MSIDAAGVLGRAPALVATLLIVGSMSEARAVFDCLPPPNCRSVGSCCKKPRVEFWLQIARAELRRDFYDSQKNRDEAFGKGAWDAPGQLEKAFGDFISKNQDALAKQRLKIKSKVQYDDVPTLTTNDDCKTTIDSNGKSVSPRDIPKLFDDPSHPLTQANVCKESVAAAIRHEEDHQDRCEAKKLGLIKPKAGEGWARAELNESADSEKSAYANEAAMLRLYWRQARQRCTTAKALANDDFENAKQKIEALKLMREPRTL